MLYLISASRFEIRPPGKSPGPFKKLPVDRQSLPEIEERLLFAKRVSFNNIFTVMPRPYIEQNQLPGGADYN
jgi:hypothetical protein